MTQTFMRSAFEIIPYLLKPSPKSSLSLITPLKLQKLLYYSQAWSLVFRGKPLFSENIEAWIHGPVVPPVYQHFKQYGYNVLPDDNFRYDLEADEVYVLNEVLGKYGAKNAKFLEELTHSEYPWIKAREGYSAEQRSNREISHNDMIEYYTKFQTGDKPPRISPQALRKKKLLHQKECKSNILSGMSSVLDISPARSRRLFYTPDDFSSSLSDFESISSDWEKVGGDILTVINLVEESSTEHE